MSLIVETGAMVSGAESYATVADADNFHSNRGNTLWATMTTAEKEQALRRATDYMEQAYRWRWAGWRVNSTQPLSWPRSYVPLGDVNYIYSYYANDVVPALVISACCEMAFKAASGDLLADLTQGVKREKIGPIETEYNTSSPQATRYASIDLMLRPLLQSGGVQVVRA